MIDVHASLAAHPSAARAEEAKALNATAYRPPLPAAMFFGLNPILLAYAVGGGHNDILMLAAALGGVYLLLAGRESGMAALVARARPPTTWPTMRSSAEAARA